jgi:RNA polymerase sigma factor (sigma-70 family)
MDGNALTDLYYARAREVLGFFVRRTHDPQAALDLLAETFLTAFERRTSCRAGTEAEQLSWLYRIAANKLMDHYRRGGRQRRTLERVAFERPLRSASAEELVAIESLAGPSGLCEEVRTAYESLSFEQREAVRLHVLEEQPYPFLSQELGISEPAARARVSRGLRSLRRALAGDRDA